MLKNIESGITAVARKRDDLWNNSHKKDAPISEKIAPWLGHKLVCTVALPLNLLEMGLCAAACGASACTLGTLKVAIYAGSLGNIKPSFSTGCQYLAKKSAQGLFLSVMTVGQLTYDVADLVYQGYRMSRWVAGKLHITHIFNAIFEQLGKMFTTLAINVGKGIDKASKEERSLRATLLPPFDRVNNSTNEYRIDLTAKDRKLKDIFKHYLLSIVNIPGNACLGVGAAAASVVLSTAFVAKVILYTTTNVTIPIPTHANQALNQTGKAISNISKDIGTNIADLFVVTYKISAALRINKVAASALQVILYIPEAIFG